MARSSTARRFAVCARCGSILVEHMPQTSIQHRVMTHLRLHCSPAVREQMAETVESRLTLQV